MDVKRILALVIITILGTVVAAPVMYYVRYANWWRSVPPQTMEVLCGEPVIHTFIGTGVEMDRSGTWFWTDEKGKKWRYKGIVRSRPLSNVEYRLYLIKQQNQNNQNQKK